MGKRAWLHGRFTGWVVTLAMVCLLFVGESIDARAADTAARSARLSYLQGSVTVNQMDNTGSDPAQLNMPLTQGVRVATGQDGQAEIEFEDGSLVRLTPNSSLDLTTLTADADGNLQTSLTFGYGLAYAELRAAAKFAYSVDAGGVVISPITNATVRLDMDQPPAAISVIDGSIQAEHGSTAGGDGYYRTNVNAGQTLTGDAGHYSLTGDMAENSWDKWNADRDTAAADEAANQTAVRNDYAGEAGYGWSDLDANGSWYNVPGEGEVWQPNVAMNASFDPYGYGSWVSYPGTGYVWASGYAWGWTPYRCGNWSYWDGFGWGWLPGSGCGGFGGWGFGGGGYAINIVRPPRNYRFQPLPVHQPGSVHPIRIGHPIANPGEMHHIQGSRTIAGQTVEPVRPVQSAAGFMSNHQAGEALRRDFPVDRTSHQPVLGRSAGAANATPVTGARPEAMQPVYPRTGAEGREAPVRPMRPEPPPQQQRQVRPQQSAPRYSSPPQPHYAPPPSAPRSAPSGSASHK